MRQIPFFSSGLFHLSLIAVAGPIDAQQPRGSFVFHVYVDPIFGDDQTAWELNPGNPLDPSLATFPRWPTATRPRPLASDVEYLGYNPDFPLRGNLQHAPYSFRTLSGQSGALDYVYSLFDDPSLPPPSAPVLPWTNPDNQAVVTHVVVHCLPGLYGPKNPTNPNAVDIDSRTGLPWNGEDFPIQLGRRPHNFYHTHGLYDRLSIQGTSALDTIFDGRGKDQSMPAYLRSNTIFQVWAPPWGGQYGSSIHNAAFIDGITIRDALVDGDFANKHGIGIHLIGNGGSIGIAISNCFIYGCAVGIALDAHGYLDQTQDRWGQHAPIIANNTILSDSVGVWAGNLTFDTPPATGLYLNLHAPLLINNILTGGDSAFEGIPDACFLLDRVDDLPLAPTMDFNAFDPAHAANGSAPMYSSWAMATTGMAVGTGVAPRVDLSQAANYFVTNLLSGIGVYDHGHDLRLSPYVSDIPSRAPGAMTPLVLNPLIGAGVNLASDRGNPGSSIRNAIGTGFNHHPGLPDGVEEAPIHAWDYDCEGFGNSRLKPRDGPILATQFGSVDIGADQCGRLIMAGYVPLTRMFAANVPPAGPTSNYRIYFVDTPNQQGLPRPLNNYVLGGDLWFANVQAPAVFEPPAPYGGGSLPKTYYTPGLPSTAREFLYLTSKIGPAPRNLACDFVPTLLSDPKLWGYPLSATVLGPFAFDIYSSNPYYQAFWPLVSQFPIPWFIDNPCVFHNRYSALPHAVGTWGDPLTANYVSARTWVTDCHLNAPATLYNAAQDANWLHGAAGFFGPWSACGGPTYATSQWCLDDACPDELPPIAIDLGIRINCEIPRSLSPFQTNTNLQTFLVIPNGNGTQTMAAPSMSANSTVLAISVARSAGLSLASLLNIPSYLGTETEYRSYARALRALTGGGQ